MKSEAAREHQQFLWTRFIMVAIGIWLFVAPETFKYSSDLMAIHDKICGGLVIILGFLSFSAKRLWAPWAICAIGVWIQAAPLIFWAPAAVTYLDDTVCGFLLVLFSIIVPGTPGVIEREGSEIPPGWTYNPSSWGQRLPIILLTFLAWMSSRYMAAYQLGYTDTISDPIFPNGTLDVITSNLSKSFPISDAGLGAFVYTLEVLMGLKGQTRRWCTMPWIVFLFGIMVVPAGLVSIILITLQPLIVGHWCAWCLLTAICMLLMIALTVDEVVAVFQYLAKTKREGQKFSQIFWKGEAAHTGIFPESSKQIVEVSESGFEGMTRGVTAPWNLLLSIILGVILMFVPSYVLLPQGISNSDHIVGAIVATLAFIAMAEVIRAIRLLNILFGAWVIFSSWLFAGSWNEEVTYHAIWGLLLIGLSLPKGKVLERYGSWDKYII